MKTIMSKHDADVNVMSALSIKREILDIKDRRLNMWKWQSWTYNMTFGHFNFNNGLD